MKTILSDLDALLSSSYFAIDSITYERSDHRCVVLASDLSNRYAIVFDDVIAFRMMDEREMADFSSSNTEIRVRIDGAVLQKVEAGGWQGTDEHIRLGIENGYLRRTPTHVAEYLLLTGYECLNIISQPPVVTIMALK